MSISAPPTPSPCSAARRPGHAAAVRRHAGAAVGRVRVDRGRAVGGRRRAAPRPAPARRPGAQPEAPDRRRHGAARSQRVPAGRGDRRGASAGRPRGHPGRRPAAGHARAVPPGRVGAGAPAHAERRRRGCRACRRRCSCPNRWRPRCTSRPCSAAACRPAPRSIVYDFGAGTFDVTVLRAGASFEVLGSDGLDDVGGLDVDARRGRLAAATVRRGGVGAADAPGHGGGPAPAARPVDARRGSPRRCCRARRAVLMRPPLLDAEVPLTLEEFEQIVQPLVDRTVRTALGLARYCGVDARRRCCWSAGRAASRWWRPRCTGRSGCRRRSPSSRRRWWPRAACSPRSPGRARVGVVRSRRPGRSRAAPPARPARPGG